MAGAALELPRWRTTVPDLLAECSRRWGLRLGLSYPPGACGYVVRAELPNGGLAALKVYWPHREAEQEADALERWDGDGGVRLLDRDDDLHALLLERCEPGTFLRDAGQERALDVFVGLLPRLWKDPDGFATIEDEVPFLLEDLDGARDAELGDAARAYLRDLVPTQGERMLVHQDLHAENVLAAEREPWLAIDPKPLAAERELGVVAIVRDGELGHSKRDVLYRLDRLCADLHLDRERTIGWTVAHTVAWSGGDDYWPDAMETVRWLLEAA